MALPVAAAVPLTAIIALAPRLEARAGSWFTSGKVEFVVGTLAGIPLVAFALLALLALARGRWKSLSLLVALVLLSSVVTSLGWFLYDMRSMPVIERYSLSGWHFAVAIGVYAAGIAVVLGWISRRLFWPDRRVTVASAAGQNLP
jgi:hypothetical protein